MAFLHILDSMENGTNIFNKFLVGLVAYNPASLTANTEATETITIEGAEVGDMVQFLLPSDFTAGLVLRGAKVTARNTLSVTIRNITAGTIDGVEKECSFLIYKPQR